MFRCEGLVVRVFLVCSVLCLYGYVNRPRRIGDASEGACRNIHTLVLT